MPVPAVETDVRTMTMIWLSRLEPREALAKRSLRLEGPRNLCRRFPIWLQLSFFFSVSSASSRAASGRNREGRLYLDLMRIAYGQHVVAPYAVRARPGAPVATPIDWRERESGRAGARMWDTRSVVGRLEQKDDPWKGAWRRARSLGRAMEQLEHA